MKKTMINALIALLLLVALLSALILLWYENQRTHEKGSLEALKSQVFQIRAIASEQIPEETLQLQSDVVADNLKILQTQNEDLAAWINIPGTQVDYPVMHTPKSPEYYLQKNFEEKYSLSGLPFMQADCSLSPQSDNLILYGHNMKDDTMFSQLLRYSDKAFWDKHPIINFYTPTEKQIYEMIAVIETMANTKGAFEYDTFVNASDENAFGRFVTEVKQNSLYDTGIEAAYGDHLMTLSTCSNNGPNSRLVVVARQRVE